MERDRERGRESGVERESDRERMKKKGKRGMKEGCCNNQPIKGNVFGKWCQVSRKAKLQQDKSKQIFLDITQAIE